jgi:hypothetical protein
MMAEMWKDVQIALLVVGLAFSSPLAWAQPLEVRDIEVAMPEIETRVAELITEVAARDPELAQEIERQSELCMRDISDGRMDDEGFTSEAETFRDVQTEVASRVVQAEVEEQAAALAAQGDAELASDLRTAFTALGTTTAGPAETMGRAEARTQFEQVYSEVLARDPQEAARMKEMFEKFERGEFEEIMRPTPETMERMHQEMEKYFSERPEMEIYGREVYAHEWDRYAGEFGAGHDPREWGHEMPGGEGPWRDMPEGFTPERMPAEFEHYREMMDREIGTVLDNKIDTYTSLSGGSGSTHVLVETHTMELHGHSEGHWDGNGDMIADHTHLPGTAPH